MQKEPYGPDYLNEYKECLAMKIYSLFGVKTPNVVVSKQPLSLQAQDLYKWVIDNLY